MLFYLDELLIERRYALFVLERHILHLSYYITLGETFHDSNHLLYQLIRFELCTTCG